MSTPTRLVGRDDELAAVLDRLELAAAGAPAAVVLAGDAGLGKTRLAGEVASRAAADGWTVLRGACVELSEGAAVLAPVATVLRQLARDRGDTAVARLLDGPARWLAPLVPELGVEADGPGDVSSSQVLVAFHRLLRDLADERPVLLVLEDLHWADSTTRDLLRHVTARMHDERLLVLATVRTDDLDRGHPLRPVLAEVVRRPDVGRVDLGPLDADALLAHLVDLAGDEQGPDLAAIVARSGGNPFYAEELLATGDDGVLPPSLEDVLSLRLQRLPADAQQLLGEAAVLGASVDPVLLGSLTRLDRSAARSAVRAALDDGVLVRVGRGYAFRHALLREVALDRLLPDERAAAHAAAAAALESDPDRAATGRAGAHGQAAHHWGEAGDVPRCLAASVAAAEEAMRVFASAEALHHSQRAIELWDRVDAPEDLTGTTRLSLMLTAARAAAHLDHPDVRALGLAAVRAADEAGDVMTRAVTTATLTQYLISHDQTAAALRLASDERARHGEDRTPAASLALTAHARAVSAAGDGRTGGPSLDAVAAELDRAVEIARASGSRFAEHAALVGIVHGLGPYLPDRHEAPLARLFALAEQPDDRHWAHFLAAFVPFLCGDFARVETELDRWRAFASVAGTPARSRAALWSMSLHLDVWRGRLDRALEQIDGADLRDHDGNPLILLWMVGVSGDALRWTGHHRRALDRAEFAAATAEGALSSIHIAAELAAGRAAAGASPRRVVAAARGTSASAGPGLWHAGVAQLVAAVAVAADGRRIDDDLLDEVDGWIERLARHVDGLHDGAPVRSWATACLHQARAERALLAGTPDPDMWDAVVDDLDHRGGVAHAAVARLRRATARVAADGATSRACEEDLLAAWHTFGDLAMTAPQREATALAHRLRVRLPRRAGDDADDVLSVLTDREREVLALVAEGWTNKRVGQHLFISPKTVSVHLSNAMRKLDVDSRTQAVVLANRAGLTPAT